jgi:hypothetical protein
VDKATVNNILRRVFILLKQNGLILKILGVDRSFEHLIISCKDVQLIGFLVPRVAIRCLEGELLVIVRPFDQGCHFFYLPLRNREHAEPRGVELKAKNKVTGSIAL